MQKGITIFCCKIFVSQCQNISSRNPSVLQFLVSKNVRDKRRGGNHDFPSKLFGLTVPNHFVEEPFCVSRKLRVSKNFMLKRGISPFSIENVLSHTTKKLHRGALLCFTKFLVSKNIMDMRGREYHDFPSIFCLTKPKKFVGEPFRASLISGIEKFYA